ncbi:sensor histidine kinase [Paenibacillus terrigena]|uniref:sensor histidine kinase n=1 Tax=Paenibacillus terrigena TaxID=369333 RepID=UPI00036B70EA|nr:sensor histidine kinase [Paenibacillus terrigena]
MKKTGENMRIRTKLVMVNALIATLLLGSLTYGLSVYTSRAFYNKTVQDVHFSVSQLAQNVDNMLLSYEQLVDSLYSNVELQHRFFIHYPSQLAAQEAYFNYFVPFTKWIKANHNLIRLTIYTDNPTFQFADVKLLDSEMVKSEWYDRSLKSDMDIYSEWIYNGYDTFFKLKTFRLIKRIKVESDHNLFVAIDLSEKELYNLTNWENQNKRFMMVLPNGQIAVDNFDQTHNIRELTDEPELEQALKNQGDSFEYTDPASGDRFWLSQRTLHSRGSVQGMRILVMTPLEELSANVHEMERIAVVLCVIAIGLSALLIYSSTSRLTKRLMTLARHMQKVDDGRLTERMADTDGRDEISVLGTRFNNMMGRIESLISDVYVAELHQKELELRRKEAEMYALQTQVNPHYLFNTLNAIRGNLLERGDRDNARIVMLLADSFRNVLRQAGHLIPLKEERNIVETYLEIQRFRYGERMQYEIEMPDALQEVLIPRLALQTVVENAVIHAVDRSKTPIRILLEAREDDEENYMLSVTDNGPGMTEQRLEEVRTHIEERSDAEALHLGIRNTHQRLLSIYGESYGVIVNSEFGAGTKVTLRLRKYPVQEHMKDE